MNPHVIPTVVLGITLIVPMGTECPKLLVRHELDVLGQVQIVTPLMEQIKQHARLAILGVLGMAVQMCATVFMTRLPLVQDNTTHLAQVILVLGICAAETITTETAQELLELVAKEQRLAQI